MGLAFVTEEAVAGYDFLIDLGAVFYFKDGTFAAEYEDGLAAVVMGMKTYRCARNQTSLEHPVLSVKIHVCMKFLFSALEGREYAYR